MARLRPELTMPMFSEITHRFQTARSDVRALLLQGLLPWLENMELVATSVPAATPFSYIMYYPDAGARGKREGTGSTEATEMILNNLFYITAKVNFNCFASSLILCFVIKNYQHEYLFCRRI